MTAENSPLPLTQNSISNPSEVGPGVLIRQGRERARMSIDELAAATKLGRNQIDALERDDFSALLEPVYVRGYYRKCAKILGLQDADLIKAYDTRVAPKPVEAPSKLRLASGTDLGSGSRLPFSMALVAAAFAVIFCVFLWNIFKAPEAPATITLTPEPTAVTTEPVAVAPTPAPVVATESPVTVTTTPVLTPAQPTSPSLGVAPAPVVQPTPAAAATPAAPAGTPPVVAPKPTALVAPASAPVVVATPKPSQPVPTPAATPVAPKPVVSKPVETSKSVEASKPVAASDNPLTLSASITSWVRVEDSQGKTLINSLMRSGEKKTLNGAAPYKVFLGNAPGVRLEYKGKIQDISGDIADNLTARVTVPAN